MKTFEKITKIAYDVLLIGAIIILTGHVIMSYYSDCGWTRPERHETEKREVIGTLGDTWHYAIPHNKGNELEDANGCPCVTLASGYTTYANLTNAVAHGYGSVFEELRKIKEAEGDTSGTCKIADILAVEAAIMKKIQEKKK